METLSFDYRGGQAYKFRVGAALVGVVSSGNLEVLIEKQALGGACRVDVTTTAVGFAPIWQAVIDDFFARHALADIHISINDVGATPAVVALRLDQSVEVLLEAGP